MLTLRPCVESAWFPVSLAAKHTGHPSCDADYVGQLRRRNRTSWSSRDDEHGGSRQTSITSHPSPGQDDTFRGFRSDELFWPRFDVSLIPRRLAPIYLWAPAVPRPDRKTFYVLLENPACTGRASEDRDNRISDNPSQL